MSLSHVGGRKKEEKKGGEERKGIIKPPLNPMLQNLVVVKDATTQEIK
jgi:hypothetical protein